MINRALAARAALVVGLFPLQALTAQVVRGRVVESRSDLPVQKALISLLDSKKTEIGVETHTDTLGRFTIDAPAPGRYIIRSRRIGYNEFYSIPRDVGLSDTVSVNLWPEANAQLLDSVLTVDERTARDKALHRKPAEGRGQFIDRATILTQGFRDVADAIVSTAAGSEIRYRDGQVAALCYRQCCSFAVYRNGIPATVTGDGRASVIQLQIALATRAKETHGIELYVGRGEIPLAYREGAQGHCGVLGYWTRQPN